MLLDYPQPQTSSPRTTKAIIFALVLPFVIFAALSAWCMFHTIQVAYALEHSPSPFLCIQAEQEWTASLGLPLKQTIPIGLLTGGVALVSFVQLIRHVNALKHAKIP
jgi:hypothetical protein